MKKYLKLLLFFLIINNIATYKSLAEKPPVLMSAESISEDKELLIVSAEGNVELVNQNRVLRADKLIYYRKIDVLEAKGNISILEQNGDVFFAEHTKLTGDLKEGFLQNLGVLLSDKTRIAARSAIVDKNSNTIQYNKVVYSRCNTCNKTNRKSPLWQIKADQALHNKKNKTISYRDLYIEAFGVPVAYTPFLSHPDPTVKRKSGILQPSFTNSSFLGLSYNQPIYLELKENKDLLINHQLTSKQGIVLSSEYRRLHNKGELKVSGSGTHGTRLKEGKSKYKEIRGHLDARFAHKTNSNWTLGTDMAAATDPTYLGRYGFGRGGNFLTQHIFAEKKFINSKMDINGYHFQPLAAEIGSRKVPLIFPSFTFEWNTDPKKPGVVRQGIIHSRMLHRPNATSTKRFVFSYGGYKPYITLNGHMFDTAFKIRNDLYRSRISQDTGGGTHNNFRFIPTAIFGWKLPLTRAWEKSTALITPKIQLIATPVNINPYEIPNDDSSNVELTASNLFTDERFPGFDRVEDGVRVHYGFENTLKSNSGAKIYSTIGRAYRSHKQNLLGTVAGFPSKHSDIVGNIIYSPSKNIDAYYDYRLTSKNLNSRRNRVKIELQDGPRFYYANYVQMRDVKGSGKSDTEQIGFSLGSAVMKNWKISLYQSRNLVGSFFSQPLITNLNIGYKDECALVNFHFSRDHTSTIDIPANTSVGFTIKLVGL